MNLNYPKFIEVLSYDEMINIEKSINVIDSTIFNFNFLTIDKLKKLNGIQLYYIHYELLNKLKSSYIGEEMQLAEKNISVCEKELSYRKLPYKNAYYNNIEYNAKEFKERGWDFLLTEEDK